ncbi:hypothetical protein F5Y17DRAFT_83635 [Xylariaceae sp. FL0594]|nr:hypothetical protein F5Y17DRAFT_83635 [Xylariaceae sp. FL0594]
MENQPSDSSRRRSGNETGAKAEQSIFAGKHFGVAAKAPADTKVSNAEEAWAEIQVARPYNPEAHPAPAPAPTTLVPVPPQSEPAAPESVPSNPIPIPGAQGAARLPTQFPGGLIAMDTSRAPVPAKDIELIKEGEANDLVYKERYCRLKQGHMKWAAEQTARGAPGRATTTVAEERVETSLAEEEEEEEEEGTKTEPEQEEPKAIIPLQGFRVGANAIMLGPDQTRAAEERSK